jgi:hypothetical protein
MTRYCLLCRSGPCQHTLTALDGGEDTNDQLVTDGGSLLEPEPGADDERIDGPIAERDKYGDLTGHHYHRCLRCGAEAMRPQDLDDCCQEGR